MIKNNKIFLFYKNNKILPRILTFLIITCISILYLIPKHSYPRDYGLIRYIANGMDLACCERLGEFVFSILFTSSFILFFRKIINLKITKITKTVLTILLIVLLCFLNFIFSLYLGFWSIY